MIKSCEIWVDGGSKIMPVRLIIAKKTHAMDLLRITL